MNYQTAAKLAIKEWDAYRRSTLIKEIEKGAQFRRLTVYESSGWSNKLSSVLFGLEFCDKNGENYREIMISVAVPKSGTCKTPLVDVRLYTISNI